MRLMIKWLIPGGLLAIPLILGLVVTGQKLYERRVLRQLPPDVAAYYQTWRTERLNFPPEAIAAPPFRPETVEAARAFRSAWQANLPVIKELENRHQQYLAATSKGGKGNQGSNPDNPDQLSLLAADLPKIEPALDAFATLVNQPDYEIDALAAGVDPVTLQGLPRPDFVALRQATRLLLLKTQVQARAGRIAEALATAEMIGHAARAHRYSLLVSRMIGVAMMGIDDVAWKAALANCQTSAQWTDALSRLDRLAPIYENLVVEDRPLGADHLGMIRIAEREGITVQVDGHTGQELMIEWQRAQGEFLEQVVKPRLTAAVKGGDSAAATRLATMERTIREIHHMVWLSESPWLSRLTRPYVTAMLYAIAIPGFSKANKVSVERREHFRTLRQSIAQRLMTPEANAARVAGTTAVAPGPASSI